ncbi:MAG TPA: hypothetical protein ENL06_01715 [Candidatus Portnoybacteria bacterium]|nr:hypothetical protein [Candidatus Portnoybacteria bacterium]
MKNNVAIETQKKIRGFFKELIRVYREKKYVDEIIKTEPDKDRTVPSFQLRFVKKGEKSIYYRVLLDNDEKAKENLLN